MIARTSENNKPQFERIHPQLGEHFYDEVEPANFPQLTLRYRNNEAANSVGIGHWEDEIWCRHFGAFDPIPDTLLKPLALRYHGHQFQNYNPDLGDGRGFLFGQLRDLIDNRLMDLGTKGSGTTPWSRGGDGRLTLKGGVREILATNLLDALGVDTSKSLSLIETHEELTRGDEPSPTRSSILVRLSHSHIRIGTFQRFQFLEDPTQVARLINHCITHYMPHCAHDDGAVQSLNFLKQVIKNVAKTGARWMQAGFVHGVLNTDNINVTGESFDYGPWRFVPVCDPKFTAAYFDQNGLYAFGRQPQTLQWNLTRLAECLLPFVKRKQLETELEQYGRVYTQQFVEGFIARLGVKTENEDSDRQLAAAFWDFLEASQSPFEQAFFDWYGGEISTDRALEGVNSAHYNSAEFKKFRDYLANYQPAHADRLSLPYFQNATPTTMLIGEVEAIWKPIAEDDDWQLFEEKLAQIEKMKSAIAP